MSVLPASHQQRLTDAAYVLRLRDAGAPVPVPGNAVAARDGAFPLPIPPQSIKPQQGARIAFMDTRFGVLTDEQGMSPPQWDLGGQFLAGGQRVGNRVLDQYEVQRALEGFVRFYLDANRQRALARRSLIQMEWHDFYADEHWFVAPVGVPMGERDQSRPTVERWSLRLRGLRPTATPADLGDDVRAALFANVNVAIGRVCPVEAGP